MARSLDKPQRYFSSCSNLCSDMIGHTRWEQQAGRRLSHGAHQKKKKSCLTCQAHYCTITTKCSHFCKNFLAEMAENFSFNLRQIKKRSFFLDVMRDVNTWS